jgi:hypothetical protein
MLHCGEHHSSLESSTPQSGVESLVGAPLDSDLSSTLFLSRTWLMRHPKTPNDYVKKINIEMNRERTIIYLIARIKN